jgi:hypothetical protein
MSIILHHRSINDKRFDRYQLRPLKTVFFQNYDLDRNLYMPCEVHLGVSVTLCLNSLHIAYSGMRRITTDRIYDGGPIRL